MSGTNYLNVNVDTLFEQHSVAEIDIVHKKIQAVVETKREELRTMVGERYRDLLQAADTITAMQDSSSTLITQVECITANCQRLNEQQLIGFKTNHDAASDLLRNRNANKQLNNYFSTMVQIKLLTSLPELIWSHIDKEHFFAATELFIYSRHISTGLQLDAHNPLMQQLPVAKKQWEILKPFHVTIKQKLLAALEREELTAEVTADCLLSLLLLEKSNLNAVLKTFLQLRAAAYLSCLSGETKGEQASERRRVKDRILASLRVLNSTVELMGKCFLDDGLLLAKLSEHADPNAPPTLALMDSDDAQFSYMLPDIISNYRPKFEAQQLDHDKVRAALELWLQDTQRIAGVQLKQLFELVTSMNSVQELKSEALACRSQFDLAPLADKLKLSDTLDFYERQYVPLINQRVRDIINGSCVLAFDGAYAALQLALQSVAAEEDQMWLECSGDLPLSLEEALSDDDKRKQLLMKTKGYGRAIIALCTALDSKLAAVVAETGMLLDEPTAKVADKLALIEFLRETIQTVWTEFISRVKSLDLAAADTPARGRELLLVVRTCVALVDLCPQLKVCFCQQASWRQWAGNALANGNDSWTRMCALVEDECFHFWQQLVDDILAAHNREQPLHGAMSHDFVLQDFAKWETITLAQKDEQDNAVTSTLHIPCQPRISLQCYLFALIRTLNAAIPQTLPARVLYDLNVKLLRHLVQHYGSLAAPQMASSNTASQNVALQLYFDLRFLQLVFAVTRDERALCEQFQAQLLQLKELIDPFDFELFAEPLASNVQRSVARLQCQFGVLTPKTTNALANAGSTPAPNAHDRDPNVLSLSASGATSLWFPLLPIITAQTKSSSQPQKRDGAAKLAQPSVAPASGSAAQQRRGDTMAATMTKSKSFFGAMSQEWFR